MSPLSTASVEGVCTNSSGWQARGAGPSCTFVGAQPAWRQDRPAGSAILVAGCARHLAGRLSNVTIPMLSTLHISLGSNSAVYVFDDDPLDQQRNVLQAWAARSSFVRLILTNEPTGDDRIQRLALCRNILVQEARKHVPDDGVFLMLDLDCRFPRVTGVEWQTSWLRLLHGVNSTSTFGVLASSNPGAYRDMWALRSTHLGMSYDCFWDFDQMKQRGNCKAYRLHVHPSLSPFDIEAGFDGAAAYSAAALRRAADCQHSNQSDGHVVSEHVPFQQCVRGRGVRVGLAPWFFASCAGWKTKERSKRLFLLPNGTLALAGYSSRDEKEFRSRAKNELGAAAWAPWGTSPSRMRGWY